jgi:hypothetical protein
MIDCLFWCKSTGPFPENMTKVIPLIHRFYTEPFFWSVTYQGWRVDYCGRYRFCSKRVFSICKEFSGANSGISEKIVYVKNIRGNYVKIEEGE